MALEITPGSADPQEGVLPVSGTGAVKPVSAGAGAGVDSETLPTSGVGVKAQTELKELEATRSSKSPGVSGRSKVAGTSDLIALMKTSRGGVISTAATTLLILAGMLFFAITPAITTIQAQLDKNQQLQDVNGQMNQKYQRLVTLKKKEDDNAASLTRFNELFSLFGLKTPEGTRQKEVYAEINTMASASGLSFQTASFSEDPVDKKNDFGAGAAGSLSASTVRPKEPNIADRTRYMRIAISLTGNIADFPKMLAALETSKRVYLLESVNIGQNKGTGGTTGQTFQLSLLTLYWRSESAL